MKKIYIAHPLQGNDSPEWGDRIQNIERYLRFVAMATNGGDVVISWIHHALTKDRGWAVDEAYGETAFEFYLSRDEKLLELADELWLAGPPAVSRGVARELAFAQANGIKVVSRAEWFDPSFIPDITRPAP